MFLNLHDTYSCVPMHCSSVSLFSSMCVCFSPFLSFCTMAPKVRKFVSFKNPISRRAFTSLLFLLIFSYVIQTPKRILMKTFLAEQFLLNARSSYLVFQIQCYLDCLDHEDGNPYVNDWLAILTCLYRSSTPTYTLSIPLYLNLLHSSTVHVSLLLQSLSSKYSKFQG